MYLLSSEKTEEEVYGMWAGDRTGCRVRASVLCLSAPAQVGRLLIGELTERMPKAEVRLGIGRSRVIGSNWM